MKTWHAVEINEYGAKVSEAMAMGFTEGPFGAFPGVGTIEPATVSGTHPRYSVRFRGTAISLYIYVIGSSIPIPGVGIITSEMTIDYDLSVSVDLCNRLAKISGRHDGYPSYMASVNTIRGSNFNQANLGLHKLLPPMDVSANTEFFW